jgi:hypothetical protein
VFVPKGLGTQQGAALSIRFARTTSVVNSILVILISQDSLQGITGYRAARQGEPENQNFGFAGFLSHNVAIF